METLTIILVTVGGVLAILLTLVVFTVWKYIKKKKEFDKPKGNGNRKKSSLDVIDSFQVPMTYRTVNAQMPFMYEESDPYDGAPRPKISVTSAESLTSIGSLQGQKRLSVLSLSLEDKENLLARSLPETHFNELSPEIGKQQRKISAGVIEQLHKQGRRVSSVDLRGVSITEDMFIKSLGQDTLHLTMLSMLKDDEIQSNCSAHSVPEQFYKSPIVGQKRRRLGVRRSRGNSDPNSRYSIPQKRTYKKAGKITFTTQYTEFDQIFEVNILRAFDLANKRDFAEINPFIRLYLLPGKKQKQNTKYVKGSKEPLFNERVQFTDLDRHDFQKYRLKLKVYNHGRLKKNEVLGEVDIALSSIDLNAKETFNIDLFLQRSESSLASVLVSICHQATYGKLEVIVQEARHLPKTGVSGIPSPYTTVSLFKEQSIERKETQIKRGTRDPVFNESLEFDISTDSNIPLSTLSMVVTLNHSSLIGKDEVMGHVIFSLTSPQNNASDHWKCVQDTPHKHHSEWHQLIDPDEL